VSGCQQVAKKIDYSIFSPTEAAPYFAVTPTLSERGEWSFRNSNKKRPNAVSR
jgi:hypothetical protein